MRVLVTSALTSILIVQAPPALAQTTWSPGVQIESKQEDDVRSAAMRWEMGYLVLSAVDAAQTIHCLDKGICKEVNPLFGKRPSTSTILLTKIAAGAIHFTAFKHLQERHPKTALRLAQISCGLQGGVVMLNARILFK